MRVQISMLTAGDGDIAGNGVEWVEHHADGTDEQCV
jgi:hypothetical protein